MFRYSFFALLFFISSCYSLSFDRPNEESKILIRQPDFLKNYGISVESEVGHYGKGKSLYLSFTTGERHEDFDTKFVIFVSDKDNNPIFSINNAFSAADQKFNYVLEPNYKLLIAVRDFVEESGIMNYKIIFSNIDP